MPGPGPASVDTVVNQTLSSSWKNSLGIGDHNPGGSVSGFYRCCHVTQGNRWSSGGEPPLKLWGEPCLNGGGAWGGQVECRGKIVEGWWGLLKCLTLQSVFAKTAAVKWPGKGPEIKGPEVHMGAKSFLSSCEEVKNILRRESGTSQ